MVVLGINFSVERDFQARKWIFVHTDSEQITFKTNKTRVSIQ